jgi:hypothetical protein
MERTQIANVALARSDRYLREFVEALRMCPFARRCREEGRLERRVLFPEDDGLTAAHAGAIGAAHTGAAGTAVRTVLAELQTVPPQMEVALFIFPLAPKGSLESAHAFEAFGAGVRDAMPKPATFYCVAFHPDLPRDLRDAHRAVPFIRRSPDPTLQFVRIETLEAVRGADGDRYVDPSRLTPALLASLQEEESLSDAIASENFRTLEREGPDEVERLLRSIAGE